MGRAKKTHIEILRVFAIFWVIYIHTGNSGYGLFIQEPRTEISYWAYMALSICSKAAVPVFFMISGAVLLNKKEEPLSHIWKVRIMRILLCLVIFSGLYYFCNTYSRDEKMTIGGFISGLYRGNITSHLWYLYAYLSILILLPFMRALVQNLEDTYFYYLIFLTTITGLVFTLGQFLLTGKVIPIESHVSLTILRTGYLYYPVIGYFIEHRVPKEGRLKLFVVLLFVSIVLTAMICLATNRIAVTEGAETIGELEQYFGVSSFTFAPLLYLLAKILFEGVGEGIVRKIFLTAGSCTMGTYLIHIFFMRYTPLKKMPEILTGILGNGMLAALCFCLCIMCLCMVISWVWKKIPVARWIIGG